LNGPVSAAPTLRLVDLAEGARGDAAFALNTTAVFDSLDPRVDELVSAAAPTLAAA
jgi:hypothetical protein